MPDSDCQGTGQERVIPATDLRAWIEQQHAIANSQPARLREHSMWHGFRAALDTLAAWLDERTAEAPTGDER